MSDTEPHANAWRRTSPLAAIFFLGKIYQAIAKNAVQSFAPLAAFVVAYEGDLKTSLLLGATGFLVITGIIAFLRYWFFRYLIQEESILIRDGVVKKTQLDIKFDRVQAVNTEQNFIFRWFDLITLRFDTAGSAGQEGYLPAVKVTLAEDLQQRLSGFTAQRDAEDETDAPAPAPAAQTLIRYSLLDVVKVGLTSNRALIFLALLAPLIEPTIESLAGRVERGDVEDAAMDALRIGPLEGFGLLIAVIFAIALTLVTLSIAGAFLRYHRFELQSDDQRLRSTGGLLTRQEHTVRFAKVQAIHVSQNIMHRLLTRVRWRAKQAASGRESANKHFVVPVAGRELSRTMVDLVFGREFTDANLDPASAAFQRLSRRYIRSRTVMIGVLPSLIALVFFWVVAGPVALFVLVWIPIGSCAPGVYTAALDCRSARTGWHFAAASLAIASSHTCS